MTPTQLQALKAAILATPAWAVQPMSQGGSIIIRDELNALASPDWTVWRTNVPIDATWVGTAPDPAVMGYEGPITTDEVVEARERP